MQRDLARDHANRMASAGIALDPRIGTVSVIREARCFRNYSNDYVLTERDYKVRR
jgi:hypothetical protein